MTAVRAVWYSIDYCCILIFFLMIRRPPRSTRTDTPFPTRRSSDLEQLRDHQVGRRVVDRHAEEDDALPQQARPDVVAPLAAGCRLEDGGDEHQDLHVQPVGCS